MAKYSIIVPIYKVELYLKECVDSILKQEFKDYELILVDDGSPDNCPKMCDEYAKKDSKIKVIHKKNGGISDARNAGLKIAKGDYILFVDPDDYVKDNYLETIDKEIDDFDILMFGHCKKYVNKTVECFGMNSIITDAEAQEYLLSDSMYCGYLWNKVFRNDIIKQNSLMLDVDVLVCEDLLFSFQYMKCAKRIKTINDRLIFYRQRKSSAISMPVKNIDPYPLFKTYDYCVHNADTNAAKSRSKALYLKTYYKYKKSIKSGFDKSTINQILKNDYDSFAIRDKRIINMYKYVPHMRSIIYGTKGFLEKKYE